jgi:hypothetical protein
MGMPCLLDRPVFLFNVPVEGMLDKTDPVFPAYSFRSVGGKGIHHHDVIGDVPY